MRCSAWTRSRGGILRSSYTESVCREVREEAQAATVVATDTRRSTPIATTGSLPFRIGVGTDGVMSVQLIT